MFENIYFQIINKNVFGQKKFRDNSTEKTKELTSPQGLTLTKFDDTFKIKFPGKIKERSRSPTMVRYDHVHEDQISRKHLTPPREELPSCCGRVLKRQKNVNWMSNQYNHAMHG